MSTCGICHKDLDQEEMSEAVLFVNDKETAIRANIHAIKNSPAHPDNLKGIGGPMVQANDRWEWRLATNHP